MKWTKKSVVKSCCRAFILILCFTAFDAVAQDKTVVIPLFGTKSTTPQTQYFSLGGEAFVPGSNVDYRNTYGSGGAYIDTTGFHALVAPVSLPQGAEVTEFTVFFYDTSSSNLGVRLNRLSFGGGYEILALVNSSGTAGYSSQTDTSITFPVIDNRQAGYSVYAYSDQWSGNDLRILGVVITYVMQ